MLTKVNLNMLQTPASGVLAGSGNINHCSSYIIGNNITTTAPSALYVNDLRATGMIYGDGRFLSNIGLAFTCTLYTSPSLSGIPTTTTAATDDTSCQIANTTWVRNQCYITAYTAQLSGIPLTPTPPTSANDLKIANTEWVNNQKYLQAADRQFTDEMAQTTIFQRSTVLGKGALACESTITSPVSCGIPLTRNSTTVTLTYPYSHNISANEFISLSGTAVDVWLNGTYRVLSTPSSNTLTFENPNTNTTSATVTAWKNTRVNVAVGGQALNSLTTGSGNIGIGWDAGTDITTTNNSIAIGTATRGADNSITVGHYSCANTCGITLGNLAQSTTCGTSIGYGAIATGSSSVVGLGTCAGDVSVAVGFNNNACNSANAVGQNIVAKTCGSSLGNNNTVCSRGVAIGIGSCSTTNSISLGNSVNSSLSASAIGNCASASDFGYAIGHAASATSNGYAFGHSATAATSGVAIGVSANAATLGFAAGNSATSSLSGVAIGSSSTSTNNGVAVGNNSIANNYNVAIGRQSSTNTHQGAVALGAAAVATASHLALGSSSYPLNNTSANGGRLMDVNLNGVVGYIPLYTSGPLTLPISPKEFAVTSASAATGTINFDVITQTRLFYSSNATGNFALNLRGNGSTTFNNTLNVNEAIVIHFYYANNSVAYYNSSLTIDGVEQVPLWTNNSVPSPANRAINVYKYTILKTAANTYKVTGELSNFADVDYNFAAVSGLWHGDGSQGSTTLTDSGPNPLTFAAGTGVFVDTTIKKFGTGSIKFSGTGSASSSNNSALNFGTGAFTIELWAYATAAAVQTLIALNNVSAQWSGVQLGLDASNNLTFKSRTPSSGNAWDLDSGPISGGFTLNNWHHILISRESSGTLRIYVNGNLAYSTTFAGDMTSGGSNYFGEAGGGVSRFTGYLDDIRITKGVARQTGTSFVPPINAYPNQ
jgi:hypothetical protein